MSNNIIVKLMPHPSGTINKKHLTFDKIKSSVKCQVSSVQRKAKGFTLIELLVVIAIIGILASFAIASFTSAQAKGRDSRRKADIDALKKALELAKGDTPGGAYYPACGTGTTCYPKLGTDLTVNLITGSYIKAMPTDPNGTATGYTYYPGGAAAGNATAATVYTLSACLENSNDTGENSTTITTSTCTSGRKYFITSP